MGAARRNGVAVFLDHVANAEHGAFVAAERTREGGFTTVGEARAHDIAAAVATESSLMGEQVVMPFHLYVFIMALFFARVR